MAGKPCNPVVVVAGEADVQVDVARHLDAPDRTVSVGAVLPTDAETTDEVVGGGADLGVMVASAELEEVGGRFEGDPAEGLAEVGPKFRWRLGTYPP